MKYKIIKEHMTDDILMQIMDIDKKFYKENYTLEWYKQRYNENNIAFCVYDNNIMIGYIVIAGIKEILYNDIKNGKYANDYNFDTSFFDYNSDYMYFASINILKEYRGKQLGYKLAKAAFNYYKKEKIVAITISKEGYHLANKFMKLIKTIDENVSIFELIS